MPSIMAQHDDDDFDLRCRVMSVLRGEIYDLRGQMGMPCSHREFCIYPWLGGRRRPVGSNHANEKKKNIQFIM